MWAGQAANKGNAHILPLPRWTSLIRFARLTIALAVIGVVVAATAIWGGYPAFATTIFTGSATLICSGYYLIATETRKVLYNGWVVMGLEISSVGLWLASSALLARWFIEHHGTDSRYGSDGSRGRASKAYQSSHTHLRPPSDLHAPQSSGVVFQKMNRYHAGEQLAAVAAGLGALEFMLSTVILVCFSLKLHQHRLAGCNAIYGASQSTGVHDEKAVLSAAAFAEPEDIVPDLNV